MWVEIINVKFASNHALVTPLAGVWVEIGGRIQLYGRELVTPLAGVWVEILGNTLINPDV